MPASPTSPCTSLPFNLFVSTIELCFSFLTRPILTLLPLYLLFFLSWILTTLLWRISSHNSGLNLNITSLNCSFLSLLSKVAALLMSITLSHYLFSFIPSPSHRRAWPCLVANSLFVSSLLRTGSVNLAYLSKAEPETRIWVWCRYFILENRAPLKHYRNKRVEYRNQSLPKYGRMWERSSRRLKLEGQGNSHWWSQPEAKKWNIVDSLGNCVTSSFHIFPKITSSNFPFQFYSGTSHWWILTCT